MNERQKRGEPNRALATPSPGLRGENPLLMFLLQAVLQLLVVFAVAWLLKRIVRWLRHLFPKLFPETQEATIDT